MNPSALLLLALKGTCALNCLAALHLAGPLPVTQRVIMDLTGFDDAAVSKGLATLRVLGLAICTGDRRRTAWQLAPAALGLPLPLGPLVSSPDILDSASLKEEEKEQERINTHAFDSLFLLAAPNPRHPESDALPADAPADRPPDDLDSPAQPGTAPATAPPAHQKALRAQLYAAFEAAGIYLQFRRPLADALLREDGPAGLRQTLGWLCYAQRRLPHVQRGAVVYISLRDGLPCDSAYLPPPALPFEAALAWALRGGEDEPDEAGEDADDDQALMVAEVPASPEDDLWRALIARLAGELSPAVIDAQLRPARLLSLGAERCLIGAPTPQSRDWLRTRLAAVLARALSELTGRALAVEIVVET